MRKTVTRGIIFLIILSVLYYVNIFAFRSDFPKLFFITLIGSVIGLIYFPYNKFFNIKNKN